MSPPTQLSVWLRLCPTVVGSSDIAKSVARLISAGLADYEAMGVN